MRDIVQRVISAVIGLLFIGALAAPMWITYLITHSLRTSANFWLGIVSGCALVLVLFFVGEVVRGRIK